MRQNVLESWQKRRYDGIDCQMTLAGKARVIFRAFVWAAFVAAPFLVVPTRLHADGLLEQRLTTDPADQEAPDLYGDRVVWQDARNGQWDIYLYDFATGQERRITTNAAAQFAPAIWDNRIVWFDGRSGRNELYLYDLTTNSERLVTSSPEGYGTPDIYGDRIVWLTPTREIYLYDLSTNTQQRLPLGSADDRRWPVIYGDRVVWHDFLNGPFAWYAYQYHLLNQTVQRIGTSPYKQEFPSIWGDRVVTYEYRNNLSDIFLYDLVTGQERRITTDPADQWYPWMQGNRIVWVDRRNEKYPDGNYDIYAYDLTANREFPITTHPAQQMWPKVWGDRIVWVDRRNGNTDLYAVDLSATSFTARHPLATGTEVFNFVNFPWGKYFDAAQGAYVYTYGMDFGFCPLLDAKRLVNNPQIAADLDALQSVGVEGIRWFLIPDGRNLIFDANRVPTGRGAGFREDLWAALDLLAARQMSVIFTLIDGNTWFKPPSAWQGALFGHGEVILNSSKRQAFYNTVIIPILQDLADWAAAHPSEPFPVAAIDLGNELYFGTSIFQGTGVMIIDMQTYVREVAALVHQHLPGIPVTVGEASADTLVNYWTDSALGVTPGQGLDFYSFHHHGSQPLQGPNGVRAQYGLDQLGKRLYLQEFPGKNAPLGDPGMYLAPIGGTRSGQSSSGWLSGSYLWSLNGADDPATPTNPLVTLQQIADWFAQAFSTPDFIISQVSVPPSLTEGDLVPFDVQVANRGGVQGGANRVELWLDGVQLAAQTLGSLEEGDTVTLTVPQPPWVATIGSHNLWTKADVWLQVPEANENNNEATATVVVGPGLPDLVIAALAYPASLRGGDKVQFSVTVKNQGVAASGASRLEMWLDGTQLAAVQTPSLAPGASTTMTLPATPWVATTGSHSLWTKTDVWLEVSEKNEANNERNETITVLPGPDLVMTGLSGPASGLTGASITIANTVANQGGGSISSFYVGLYLSPDQTITTADLRIGRRYVSGLSGGASSSATSTVTLPTTLVPRTYYLGAIADYANKRAESNETNNARAGNLISVQ